MANNNDFNENLKNVGKKVFEGAQKFSNSKGYKKAKRIGRIATGILILVVIISFIFFISHHGNGSSPTSSTGQDQQQSGTAQSKSNANTKATNPWKNISPTVETDSFSNSGYTGTITASTWPTMKGGSSYAHPGNTDSKYAIPASNSTDGILPITVTVTNTTSAEYQVDIAAGFSFYGTMDGYVYMYCSGSYESVDMMGTMCGNNNVKGRYSVTVYGYISIPNYITPEFPNGIQVKNTDFATAGVDAAAGIVSATSNMSNNGNAQISYEFADSDAGIVLRSGTPSE